MEITKLTGLDIQPESNNSLHGFYIPSLSTTEINTLITKAEMRNGAMVYDNVVNLYKVYQNGAVHTLNAAIGTVGVGLTSGSPIILPSGDRNFVEVPANEIFGFIYYDTLGGSYREWNFISGWNTW